MNALIDAMLADLGSPAFRDALAGDVGSATRDAIGLLRQATQSVCDFLRKNSESAQGVAVPYLTLCGVAIGGWLMAKSYALAVIHQGEDREFFTAKQHTVRFYAENALPETVSLARVVQAGAQSVIDADPEQVFRF
jgi:hypothetical protein